MSRKQTLIEFITNQSNIFQCLPQFSYCGAAESDVFSRTKKARNNQKPRPKNLHFSMDVHGMRWNGPEIMLECGWN